MGVIRSKLKGAFIMVKALVPQFPFVSSKRGNLLENACFSERKKKSSKKKNESSVNLLESAEFKRTRK